MAAIQKQWLIGYFSEENQYSVVPNNWIIQKDDNKLYCKWPTKQRVTPSMLSVAYDLLTDYMLYPVEILENYGSINDSPLKVYSHGNKISEENLINSQNKLKKISAQEFNLSSNVVLQKKPSEEVIILSPPSKLKKIDSQEVNYSSLKNNFILNNVNQCYDDNIVTSAAVFDTHINIEKTNISTNILPELDHYNSISAENISNKVTVDKVKQASNFRRPLFNAMMAYNNNYENIESSIFNENYGNHDDINNTSLNIGVEVLPPVKTTSMSNNLVACLDNNEIDKGITHIKTNYLALLILYNNIYLFLAEIKFSKSNISQMLVLLKNIVEDNFTTIAYMKRLDGRLDKIEKAIRDMTYGRNNVSQLDDDFLTLFPIPNIDSLKNIEEKIKNDEEFKLKLLKKRKSICNMSKRNFERIIESEKFSAYSNVVNITTATSVKQNNTIIFNNINDSSTTQILASTNVSSSIPQTYVCSNFNSISNSTNNVLTNMSVPNNSNHVISDNLSLEEKLKNIIIKYHVSHNFVNELLEILRCEGLKLPKDVRTLLRTPKNHEILVMDPETLLQCKLLSESQVTKFAELKGSISQLTTQVVDLKNENGVLRNNINDLNKRIRALELINSSNPTSTVDFVPTLLQKISERERFSRNVIIRGIPESTSSILAERITSERHISIKSNRLGKPSDRGPCPLKVFLSSKEVAHKLIADFNIGVRNLLPTVQHAPSLSFAIVHQGSVNLSVIFIPIWITTVKMLNYILNNQGNTLDLIFSNSNRNTVCLATEALVAPDSYHPPLLIRFPIQEKN
ncbi:hypothetical protein ACI65C_001396 [Semiaphis heraclei]